MQTSRCSGPPPPTCWPSRNCKLSVSLPPRRLTGRQLLCILFIYVVSGKRIEELAHFPDMTPEEYIAGQMVYPADLLEKNIPGFALCEFTIDKEGVILRPHIVRSTHPEFAEEALRIVKGMPKWAPALVEGRPADSNYTLYIPFRPQNYRAK